MSMGHWQSSGIVGHLVSVLVTFSIAVIKLIQKKGFVGSEEALTPLVKS